jgi:uncharacterized protein (TIGR03084 family)
MAESVRQLVQDLRDEQLVLDRLVAALDPADWLRPTPAAGWDVRDSITHLVAVDELAIECVAGRHEALERAFAYGHMDTFNQAGVERGRDQHPTEVLRWWRETRERLNQALEPLAAGTRIPWGGGPMGIRAFVMARLVECWAHGLDCFAAIGATPVDTDRLRHVCWLSYLVLPHAFEVAGRVMPAALEDLRIEVTGPAGQPWLIGLPAASQRITGYAGEWARVAVQRLPFTQAGSLRADGPLAEQALEVARAYL